MSSDEANTEGRSGPLININIDLKHASKAATKLIDAVGRGLGLLYEPVHVKRIAAAYRSAHETISATPEAQTLYDRSVARMLGQELRIQRNIEGVASKALAALPASVNDEPVDEDWMSSFFDMCKNISDEQMQSLWARLLAGEVATPGTYSLRTLHTVKMLSKDEAEAFTLYCRYLCKDSHGYARRIQNETADKYLFGKVQLHYGYCEHFVDIGLVSGGMPTLPTHEETRVTTAELTYFGRSIVLAKDQSNFPVPYLYGIEPLTAIGHELHAISGATADYDYFDVLVDALREEGFVESPREANNTPDGIRQPADGSPKPSV